MCVLLAFVQRTAWRLVSICMSASVELEHSADSMELEHSADSMDCSHPHPDPRALVQLDVDKTDASSSCARRLHEPKLKYDIFINHRGPDTKLQFVTSLEDALKEKHYTPFVDRSLEVGTHAFEAIEAAIKDASVQVAIFSARYAESRFCLDELVVMLECIDKNPSEVTLVPVFYGVEPHDLRLSTSPFCAAFRDSRFSAFLSFLPFREKARKYPAEQVSRWKKALHHAAAVKGFEFSSLDGDTNELKKKIIRRVQAIIAPRNALRRRQPVPRPYVGGKELLEGKLQQLEEMGDNVAILGICGMGGMGKTRLAQEIYNHYSASGGFLYLTFLKIGELEDVSPLQKQALRELLNKKEKNLVEGYVSMFESLVGVKVLIVIDDISNAQHFKELVPNIKKLGAGSRIILTSRRKDTLRVAMSVAKSTAPEIATLLHQMKELNPIDSFELFWFHAFHNRELPKQTYDIFRPLAEKVVERCSGLPLALKIIGQHLYGKPEEVWKDAAKSMRERPGIIDVLSISYHGLDSRSEKMMFLDVSCQMFGLLEKDAVDIWKSCESCRAPSGCITSKMVTDSLHVLKDKSLVEVDKDGRLTMHDLLKEMGRKMDADDTQVCAKNGRLSFHLWDPLDAKDALDNDEGTKDVRGLSLVGLNSSYDAKTFKLMPNIHLLQLDGARIEGDFSQMSKKIRWLQWRVALFTELPQLDLEHLAILDVSESRNLVRLWSDSGTKVPKLLRVLLLHNCIALEKLPETIKSVTMLRALNLQGCKSLKELPDSLGELRELEDLNLSECECLEGLPDGMVKLSKLKTFSMNGCSNIKQLPVDFGELSGSLTIFSAQDASSLTCLPDSFSRLSRLEELRLSHCLSFTEFPKSVKSLAKLRVIGLHATGLTHLPDDFGELPSLVELHLNCCNSLESLPESFGNLPQLKVLSLQKSEKFRILSSTFGQLQGLTDLNLEQCSIGDGDFPANFGGLKRLTTLLMQKNKMTTLPDSFRDLEALATLNMRGSLDLTNVQALPAYMEELFLACCPKIVGVNLVDKLSKLRKLILINCTRLTDIEGLESTVSLNHINLSGCVSLSKIYENLLFISTLKECYISGIKVRLKYNNNWSQVGAPSAQVVSYYDHAIGFMDNTMTRKICSVQDANELCVEARISTTSVAAVVIAVVAHDQGFSDFPHLHGEYNGNCNIEARIVRSDGEAPVFSSQLLALRHADCRDQVYVCTLRKSHPLITRLKEGDRICVYARSIYRGWRITVMKGGIWVVYDKKSPGPDNFPEGLYLKDGLARSIRLPRVVQAVTLPVLLQSFQAGAGGGSLPTAQWMMRCVCVPIFGDMDTTSLQYRDVRSRYGRICDLCQTLISSQRGWHCEVCDDIDMCEACFLSSTEKSDAQLPFPHESDHRMSVFEAPDSTEDAPYILMPFVEGEEETNWGYVVYEYSTVRWSETFE